TFVQSTVNGLAVTDDSGRFDLRGPNPAPVARHRLVQRQLDTQIAWVHRNLASPPNRSSLSFGGHRVGGSITIAATAPRRAASAPTDCQRSTLPEDPVVTDLENHDLVELRALPGAWQRPPLAVLCSRDGQMDHNAIAFGDEFVNLLVVVRERCPSAFDHGTDALVSFAKGIRAIVPHEIRRVELGDRIKAPAVPDDGGDLVDQPLVL